MGKFITVEGVENGSFYILKYLVKKEYIFRNGIKKQFTISIGVQGKSYKEVDTQARKKIREIYKEVQITFVSFQHHDNLLMLS